MRYIEPHIHMASRTADDYVRLAHMGCVAVSEPAFWAGFDRSAAGFHDYFRHLVEFEPRRAWQYGIRHFCWLCINSKEAEDLTLARDVIRVIPEFIDSTNVLGIGEIGLNKNTRNEAAIFDEQLELAARRSELVLVHTPHLRDKYKGTRMILDMIANHPQLAPERIIIDHCEEHTIRPALDRGYWAGITLYPTTKATPQRAADMVERYGGQKIWVNSSADWGPSDPASVPAFMLELRLRGHSDEFIGQIVYGNPIAFFSQCARWPGHAPNLSGIKPAERI